MSLKFCSGCQKILSFKNFYNSCGNKCKFCKRKYQRNRAKQYPDLEREVQLKIKYGITSKEYDQLLHNQHGVCKICKLLPNGRRYKHLAVDHDHTTGKIRGLLCDKCNRGIGLFGDSTITLSMAIKYLNEGELRCR